MGALPVHHTAVSDVPWDGPAAEAAMPDHDEETYQYCFAWVDSSQDPENKSSYKDPHHKTKGGPAILDGCRAALSMLGMTDINDKDGVKAHLQAHLDDALSKKIESAAGGHERLRERTAAMPSATIEDLEAGTEFELENAQKRRTKCKLEIQHILAQAGQEGRANLTPEEDSRVAELFIARDTAAADIDGVKVKLANVKKLKAEELDAQHQMRQVEPTGIKKPAYDAVARVGREERTYNPDNDRRGANFLKDVLRQYISNDQQANTRLSRHMHEERIERSYIERSVGTSAFIGLVVPQYLTDMYAPAVAPLRPFADICNHHDLPEQGMTVNIAQITTPSGVAIQATENTAVQNTNMADTLLTENILTAAGQQTISRQASERGIGIEEIIMDDLFRRYASALDSNLLNMAVTGMTNIAQNVEYDSTTPTGPAVWPLLLQAAANSEAALLGFAQPNAVIMHSRRWYWLQSQLTNQWPMFGQPGIGGTASGENYAAEYGRGFRGMLPNGMAAVVDNNVGTAFGTGTNQDEMYVVATEECHLWEDPAAPLYLRCEQPAAANLGILMVLYGYYAFSFRRYANAVSKIGGTGMTSPVFGS